MSKNNFNGNNGDGRIPPNRPPKMGFGFIYIILIIAGIYLASSIWGDSVKDEEMNLSDMLQYLNVEHEIEDDSVENIKIEEVVLNGTELTMIYRDADNVQRQASKSIPSEYIDSLITSLNEAKEEGLIEDFTYEKPVDYGTILEIIMMILVIVGAGMFFMFTMKQNGGKDAMSFGNNRAKLSDPSKNKVRFSDVAGCAEEKEELAEMVDFLKNPDKYHKMGAKIPKGVILSGPPGTGKTLLARAVAGEAGVNFFYMSGSDFVEMFVGVGASRVRSLFADAKKMAPSLIFIDEIDAVGRKRGSGLGGGHDEREQTLNAILVEMDGFDTNTNVIVMAATNRADVLDNALLRPGRFDRKIMVSMPDAKEREAILEVHARKKPLSKEVDLHDVSLNTVGFTGADLSNLLNEAALLAARRNKKEITPLEITDATYRVMMGPERKSKSPSEKSRKLTAYHEAGHAVLVRALSDTEKVDRVTIIPVGGAGGFTSYKPIEDFDYYTKNMILTSIKVSLGGRAAEELFLDDISTGASNDLQHCNRLAASMIKKYGLSEKFKNMVFGDESEQVFIGGSYGSVQSYSDKTAAMIDDEIQRIITKCYDEAIAVLNEKRAIVEGLAERLLEVEKVDGPEFEEIYSNNGDLTSIRARDEEARAKSKADKENQNTSDKKASDEKADEDKKEPKEEIIVDKFDDKPRSDSSLEI